MRQCSGRFLLHYRVNIDVYNRLAILAVKVPLDAYALCTNAFDRVAPVVRDATVAVYPAAVVNPELSTGKGAKAVDLDADVVDCVVFACVVSDVISSSVDVNDSLCEAFGREHSFLGVCLIGRAAGKAEQKKGDSDYSEEYC